uniref:Uncharacterized protein n=1 Tax=Anopheles atroparvus TaxID=41427 RepID=A0AAG5CV00_ANOAO
MSSSLSLLPIGLLTPRSPPSAMRCTFGTAKLTQNLCTVDRRCLSFDVTNPTVGCGSVFNFHFNRPGSNYDEPSAERKTTSGASRSLH